MNALTIVASAALGVAIATFIFAMPATRRDSIARPLWAFGFVVVLSELDMETHFGRGPDLARDGALALIIAGLAVWSVRKTSALRIVTTVPVAGLTLLFVLGLLSALWSVAPSVTLQRSLISLAIVIAIAGLVETYGLPMLFRATVCALSALIAASILWETLGPGTQLEDTGVAGLARTAGLTGSPNELGRASALLLVIGATLARTRSDRLTSFAQVMGVFGVFIAQSRTALAVALLMFAVMAIRRRHFKSLAVSVWVAATGLMTAWMLGVLGLESVSREGAGAEELATATGRTGLWEFVWNMSMDQPIIGYGAFASEQILLPSIEAKLIWIAADAHNLFLNIFMTQGLIGVLALAIAPLSLLAPRQRIALAATGAGPVLVTLLALSITENSLRKPSIGLTVAVMTLAAVSVQANSPATRLASTMKPQTSRLADSFSA